MKQLLLLLSLGFSLSVSAQFDFTAEKNLRSNFYKLGANTENHIKKAGVKAEAAYKMFYTAQTRSADSLLVYYAQYDGFGNILTSVDYDEDDTETIYKYSNFYKSGKLLKRHYLKIVNGIASGSHIIQYNEQGQELFLYVYQENEPDPTVYKKQYNKKGLLQYIWEADPDSKRFSMLAKYDYLSNGDLSKITRFPTYRKRFKMVGKIFYFKQHNEKGIAVETITDEYGQEIVSYQYNKSGRCIGKKQGTTIKEAPYLSVSPANTMNHVSTVAGYTNYGNPPNAYNSASSSLITELTNRANNTNENWKPVTDPFPAKSAAPGYRHYIKNKMTTIFDFKEDETIESIITKNDAEMVVQKIHYYYNEKAELP
ncbi:MAG: hypothetical protein EOP53_08070 [Sphingobacteriales bacterium]|nr:MAG: hypothetical protein EOP53_08070 [Sphingobacteriales bacterium]